MHRVPVSISICSPEVSASPKGGRAELWQRLLPLQHCVGPWKCWKTAAQLYSSCDSSGQWSLLVATGLLVQLGLRLKSGVVWCKEQGTGWGDRHASGVTGHRVLDKGKMVSQASDVVG